MNNDTNSRERIDDLTDSELTMMDGIADEWIDYGLTTGAHDIARVRRGIEDCYRYADLEQPERIYQGPLSPLGVCVAHAVIMQQCGEASTKGEIEDVPQGVREAVQAVIGGDIDWTTIRQADVRAGRSAHFGGRHWCHVQAEMDAYRRLGLALPGDLWDRERAYADMQSGGWVVTARGWAIAGALPSELHLDAEHRLHSETGPAISWPDGWGLYVWHGTDVPDEWITDKDSMAPETALTWPNIEQRRCAAEILGWGRVLDLLSPRVLDEDTPEIGQLLEVDLPGAGRELFLRVRCGTGRDFALPVPPHVRTARQANAWTYGIDEGWDDFAGQVRT